MAEALTWENHEKAERDIYSLSGLPEECFERKFVKVDTYDGEDVNIRTIVVTNNVTSQPVSSSKPDLVWIHGYAACSGLYYTVVKRMSKYFRLILIDNIGYGCSSRPLNCDFKKMSANDYIEYFNKYFETWRKEMKLDKFYLVGHSMGGFLSGQYAAKYQENLLKVILLSPPGMA